MAKIPRDPDAWKLKRRRAGAHVSRPERGEVEREALADQVPVSRPEHGPTMTPEEWRKFMAALPTQDEHDRDCEHCRELAKRASVSRPEHGLADFPSTTDPAEVLRRAVAEGAVDRARERLLRRALEADFRRPAGVDPSQLAPSAASGEIGPGAGSSEGVG